MWVLCIFCLLFTGSAAQLDVCGSPPLNTRIVGGAAAPDGAWPWQVSIHRGGGHICGGSLINNLWVLSAAHCFQSGTAADYTVYIGRKSQEGSNPNEVMRSIVQVISHPDFDPSTVNNDMALLQMASPVTFTDYIRPVCLAALESTLYAGTKVWVTGWGSVGSGEPLPPPQNLMEVEVPIVGNRKCFCAYKSGITDNMLCAGLDEGGKDSCQGDSGGPLVRKQSDRWIQAGVVSFGVGCALPNIPGVYARVSQYQSWILSHITENQPGFIKITSSGTNSDLSVSCSGLPPVTTAAPATTAAPQVVCGQAPFNSRLSGGSPVSGHQWPWFARIQKDQVHVCGGTLVSEDAVLSDASCFPGSLNVSQWSVVLGQEVRVAVSNITLSNSSGSGVAVLLLASKPSLSSYIQPICLDDGRTIAEGTSCYVAAYGLASSGATLLEEKTSILSCGNSSSSDDICTGVFTLQQGELGGPLMCKLSGSWFQAAVLSNSSSSQTRASVMTFTRTSAYNSFLSSTLGTFLSPAASATSAPSTTPSSSLAPSALSPSVLLGSHLLLALLALLL